MRVPFVPGPLAARPRLVGAIAVGVVAALALILVPNTLHWTSRAIVVWDLACGVFVAATLLGMRGRDAGAMCARAAFEDEGGAAILQLSLLAVLASLGAVAAELHFAKDADGLEKLVRSGLAIGTMALSWTFMQLIFTLHYAHEFYAPQQAGAGKTKGPSTRGGLLFPGTEAPDYWDFLHFAMVIGVASQTADIQFTSKALRRIGTVHSVIAFGFNTLVLALAINLLASLF